MTAAAFMATLNATGAHRRETSPLASSLGPQTPPIRTFDTYRLPDGSIVRCDASATKGWSVIDFTLATGRIVQAEKVGR